MCSGSAGLSHHTRKVSHTESELRSKTHKVQHTKKGNLEVKSDRKVELKTVFRRKTDTKVEVVDENRNCSSEKEMGLDHAMEIDYG